MIGSWSLLVSAPLYYDSATTVHSTVICRPVSPFPTFGVCVDPLPFRRYGYADSLRPSQGISNSLCSTSWIHITLYATQDYIAACGCTGKSTHYPTAALSQMAFGSSSNYGPSCGRCFKLTLLNSYTGTPPFFPSTNPSIVVKVTDLCPLSQNGWCSGAEKKTNPYVLIRSCCRFLPSWHRPAKGRGRIRSKDGRLT